MPFDNTNYTQEQIYIQNLTFLRDFIADLPEENFFYGVWTSFRESVRFTPDGKVAPECGTIGCIGGWMSILYEHDLLPFKTDLPFLDIIPKYFGIGDGATALFSSNVGICLVEPESLAEAIYKARKSAQGSDKNEAIAALNAAIQYYEAKISK